MLDKALGFSSYLGGSGNDAACSVAVSPTGVATISGVTTSTDFPAGLSPSEDDHPFVTRLNADGTAVAWSTVLGTFTTTDAGYAVAVDPAGNAYVGGSTQGGVFPTTAGAFQTSSAADIKGFVCKLSGSGGDLLYSTYLSGSGFGTEVQGIAVGPDGSAYVTGYTADSDFPVTAGAFQTTFPGDPARYWPAFVTKLNPSGSALVAST